MSADTNAAARFAAALKMCDKATSYKDLTQRFHAHVLPVLTEVVSAPLRESLSEVTAPSECCPAAAQIRDFVVADNHDDVWILLLQQSAALFRGLTVSGKKRARDDDASRSNRLAHIFVLFYGRGLPKSDEMSLRWPFLAQERRRFETSTAFLNANAAERRKMALETVLSVFSEKSHRHNFSHLWSHFLTADTPSALHLHLLNRLSVDILPNLTNPLVVSDYLTTCFASGGLVAVLALKGMLLLMLDHGLEQPKFYEQLYSLLTPDAFSSRHRYELFELVDLCLKSLRVPSYIAAAFAKRIAQIALLSPAPTLYFSLPFLRQLFQRHQNCLCLIHRTAATRLTDSLASEEDAELSESAKKRVETMISELFEGKDPFKPDAKDPLSSDAIYSSLWELTLLEKQFLPAVPLMVSAFASPVEDATPLRFEKTYGRLFTAEITKEISAVAPPPVAYAPRPYDPAASTNTVIV